MYLSVYTNGKNEASRSHISVFSGLTCGENDYNLVWPFRGKITIQLLNQLEDHTHKTRVLDFDEKSESSAKRPVKGQHTGWGWPKFIPHGDLGHDPSANCQYLKDDCLYFRVLKIDIDPMNKPWLIPTM